MLIDDGYLSSGLLYHVSGRVDHRHNLSILWAVQLACSKGKEVYCWPFAKLFQTVILAALIIQRVLALRTLEPIENEEAQSVLKRRYFYHQLLSDLDQACRAFVAFNSVVTAQYFRGHLPLSRSRPTLFSTKQVMANWPLLLVVLVFPYAFPEH